MSQYDDLAGRQHITPWFATREDFDAIRGAIRDPQNMPAADFDAHRELMEKIERTQLRHGAKAARVTIEIEGFRLFCERGQAELTYDSLKGYAWMIFEG